MISQAKTRRNRAQRHAAVLVDDDVEILDLDALEAASSASSATGPASPSPTSAQGSAQGSAQEGAQGPRVTTRRVRASGATSESTPPHSAALILPRDVAAKLAHRADLLSEGADVIARELPPYRSERGRILAEHLRMLADDLHTLAGLAIYDAASLAALLTAAAPGAVIELCEDAAPSISAPTVPTSDATAPTAPPRRGRGARGATAPAAATTAGEMVA